MRITMYKTVFSDEKVILKKELSMNFPHLDRRLNCSSKVYKIATEFLHIHEQTEEYLYMLCLNNKLDFESVFEISHGTVNGSLVGIREIFQKALLANAVNIIVIHNHPSGDPTPSSDDVRITKKMIEAGHILEIEVVDHIIIGHSKYIGLKEEGYI